eukprot:COSAG01_NODE_2_length_63927_cov_1357.611941_40_plen_576_part_00
MSTQLEKIRHSAAHILAQAVQKLYPSVKLGIGPTIENGFYYDFDLETHITEKELKTIEKEMVKIIKENQRFERFDKSRDEAKKLISTLKQPYKEILIKDLNLETYSFYKNGPFVDLCKGPHINETKEVKHFKLLKVTGAYWQGNEKNKMLQRIYGTAFESKDNLYRHLKRLEEAKKRDHRALGKTLDLFSIHDEIGSGLILWHPKGAALKNIMETSWKSTHIKEDYKLVQTPHVGKANLWETSGHLEFYKENMYSSSIIDNQEYYIKPMNCPFHILIYKNRNHSYKELPIKYAELGTVYRYERSGVLHGLMRARGFTQDDAHIICTQEQVEKEIEKILDITLKILKRYGFEQIDAYISTKPKEKSVGNNADWEKAEKALTNALKKQIKAYKIDKGGGSFYGPKIDLKIKDAIGREWQCSTIQFDFNLPERFHMKYINKEGNKETPFMIHRAIFGSLERFIGILIEHHNGKFPFWLAPTQIKIICINEDAIKYCEEICKKLDKHNFRYEKDYSKEKISKKIKTTIQEKTPYMFIIGKEEVLNNTITIRTASENKAWNTLDAFIKESTNFDNQNNSC